MTAHIEEDNRRTPFFPCSQSLIDGVPDGVSRLGRRDKLLALGKHYTCFNDSTLRIGHHLEQAVMVHCTDDWRGTMVAQPSCVDARRDESMAECVHLGHRGNAREVIIIPGIAPTGHLRTGLRLDSNEPSTAS